LSLTISKFFHQSAWRNFFMYIINRQSNDLSRAIRNKQAIANPLKDHKLHSPYGLVQFCYSLKKFTRAYLFQIALEII